MQLWQREEEPEGRAGKRSTSLVDVMAKAAVH